MRRASPATLLCIGVVMLLMIGPAKADPQVLTPSVDLLTLTKPEHKFVGFINHKRDQDVTVRRSLVRQARDLADRLARHEMLFHRRVRWPHCWGQTIGYGAGPRAVFRAMMLSPPHRCVILDAAYAHVGVGVTKRAGVFWVVANFGC